MVEKIYARMEKLNKGTYDKTSYLLIPNSYYQKSSRKS